MVDFAAFIMVFTPLDEVLKHADNFFIYLFFMLFNIFLKVYDQDFFT